MQRAETSAGPCDGPGYHSCVDRWQLHSKTSMYLVIYLFKAQESPCLGVHGQREAIIPAAPPL